MKPYLFTTIFVVVAVVIGSFVHANASADTQKEVFIALSIIVSGISLLFWSVFKTNEPASNNKDTAEQSRYTVS